MRNLHRLSRFDIVRQNSIRKNVSGDQMDIGSNFADLENFTGPPTDYNMGPFC